MKGTEKILAHIQADADAKTYEIIAQTKQRCAEIRESYDIRARDAYSEKIRAGVKDCESRSINSERTARMEAKKSILALKQELVEESFAKAEELITALPQDEYTAFLAKLAADASTGGEEIILNEQDRKVLGNSVTAEANKLLEQAGKTADLTLADTAGNFSGGLILRRGNVETNCTLELLLEISRGELSAEVAALLFS